MSVDTIVRYAELNVGDIEESDSRIRYLFTHPVSGMCVYGLEFPFHKDNRSIKVTGRERVGRDQNQQAGWVAGSHPPASAFHPSPPLAEGQDDQTVEGCAVSAVEAIAPVAGGNYVQVAFIAYDPAAPAVGICVAWLNVDVDHPIAAARFRDMNVVAENKYVGRQSNITLAVLGGSAGHTPGELNQAGLCVTGLTGQLEYEIFG
ncbi:hypothetical protein ES702_07008 [subsurface metagenome]